MSNDYIIGSIIPIPSNRHPWHLELTSHVPSRDVLPIYDDSVFGDEGDDGDHQDDDDHSNATRIVDAHLDSARANIGAAQSALVEHLDAVAARQDDDPDSIPDLDNPKLVMIWKAMDAVRQAIAQPPARNMSVRDMDVIDDDRLTGFIPDYGGETGLLIFPLCDEISSWVIQGKHTLAELAARKVHYWHQDGEFVGHWDVPEGVDPAGVVSVGLDALTRINPRYLNGHVVAQFIGDALREALMSIGAPDIEDGWFGHFDDPERLDAMSGETKPRT